MMKLYTLCKQFGWHSMIRLTAYCVHDYLFKQRSRLIPLQNCSAELAFLQAHIGCIQLVFKDVFGDTDSISKNHKSFNPNQLWLPTIWSSYILEECGKPKEEACPPFADVELDRCHVSISHPSISGSFSLGWLHLAVFFPSISLCLYFLLSFSPSSDAKPYILSPCLIDSCTSRLFPWPTRSRQSVTAAETFSCLVTLPSVAD